MEKLSKEIIIGVIGLGRIGLPTALLVSEFFSDVIGIDTDTKRIQDLSSLKIPFQEEGLERKLYASKLSFSPKLIPADLYLIAVPTLEHTAGIFGLNVLKAILSDILALNPNPPLIIIESTLPLGGLKKLAEHYPGGLLYCPERVAPGFVFSELSSVPRCIAATSETALQWGKAFYESLSIQVMPTSPDVAEMVKLSENAFRDANIAFANRLSEICSQHAIDNREVVRIANTHPRVNILRSGLGAGGACLAPSTRTLNQYGLFSDIRKINDRQIYRVLERLQQEGIRSLALWGLSYKGNCDDLRSSPSMNLKALLEDHAIHVRVWDPVANIGRFSDSLKNAQAIVFGCAHSTFRGQGLAAKIRKHSAVKSVLDVVGASDRESWEKEDFVFLKD